MSTGTHTGRYFEITASDRAMAALTPATSFTPHLALELDGELDTERLQRAAELLRTRHPILGATMSDRTPGRWVRGSGRPHVADVADVAGPASSALGVPLDPRAGPTWCVLTVHGSEPPLLVVGAHHALGDGRALAVVLDDLRRIYLALASDRAPAIDVDWSPRSIGAGLDARGVSTATRLRLAWETGERWRRGRASTHLDPPADAPGAAAPTPVAASVRLDPPVVEALGHLGRARGWRRNHAFFALAARAWDDVVGRPTGMSVSGWLVAVDTRRQLGLTRGVGNLSGFEPVTLVDVGGADPARDVDQARLAFEPLADLGSGMVAELLTVPRVLTDRAFDRLVVEEVERRVATTRATRCYSNIGTLPAALADWGRVAAVGARWLPGAPPPTPFVGVLGVGFGGAVTVTVAASMQTIADPVAAAFVARLGTSVDELLGAADR